MKQLLLRSLFMVHMIMLGIAWNTYASTDKYRLTFRDDPATTINIIWNQISGENPVVHYGVVDHGTNADAYAMTKSVDRSVEYKGMSNQIVRLTGLQPNTAYYFVIKDSEGTSQRFWFKTAPSSSSERLSFIAGGDSRNNREPRQNGNRIVARLRPHAVFFGGDMTSSGTDEQWQNWFDDWQLTIGEDGRMIPIVAARGNHESSNGMIYDLFDTPSTDVYYGITFGTDLLRVYTLNTEMSITGDQTTWLANDLAANANVHWKSAQYHKPMRPHVSSKSEGNTHYSSWADLFYQNNVKLVVECDAHTVKTTWPVRPSTNTGHDEGFVRDDISGTVYTGEGCWGAPLRSNNDNKEWTRDSGMFNQVKWIFVDQSKIELRTIKVENAESVGTVNDSNIFSAPANLDIWA
ncbi:purple acid phosphatase family protein, partial [Flammeovirga agarivorans]